MGEPACVPGLVGQAPVLIGHDSPPNQPVFADYHSPSFHFSSHHQDPSSFFVAHLGICLRARPDVLISPNRTHTNLKMPRQRSAGRAPARAPTRPTAAAPAPAAQQARPASTMAAPPQQYQQAPAQSQGPGLFGQMASTAAGVAIGSSVGHAIGGFFSGGSSEPAPQQVQAQQQPLQQQQQSNNCAGATQSFTKCMDDNGGNMQICNWYLEQLKACQAAAAPY
ncbi:hypothetical protein PWT90_00288 [Aphanocladium album]|nr:hypothetical protein PWT90_00288 [Aphanocladium album]